MLNILSKVRLYDKSAPGHIWGTIRGDGLVANRRNKDFWCSVVGLTAECSTVEGNQTTNLFSFH